MLTNPFINAYLKYKEHYLAGNEILNVEIQNDEIVIVIENKCLHQGSEVIFVDMLEVMNWLWEQSQ